MYADTYNVHLSSGTLENLKNHKENQFHDNKPNSKIKEDRNAKRGRQNTKNFNKVNEIGEKGIGEKSQTPILLSNQDDNDKESDLENLTKLFKEETNYHLSNGI